MGWELWPKADDERLENLLSGGMSYGEIGKIMGRTRCAVAGRARRLGLKALAKPIVPRKPRPSRARPKPPVVRTDVDALFVEDTSPAPPPVFGMPGAFLALRAWSCKWPIGDPNEPDFCFCRARTAAIADSYCVAHKRAAFTPATAKRKAPAQWYR